MAHHELLDAARSGFPLIQAIPGVCDEICTFVRFELLKRFSRSRLERVEVSRSDHSHQRLELGEGVFDRVEVGTVGRQVEKLRPRASMLA
jgi:hypothetical protein